MPSDYSKIYPCSVVGRVVCPHYLGPADHPWLRALIAEHERYVGRPRRELEERLREPLGREAPADKLRWACRVLARRWPDEKPGAPRPREVRRRLFLAAADRASPREEILSQVARALEISPPALEGRLFADVPGERNIGPAPADLSPTGFAQLANRELVQGLLRRSQQVDLDLVGNARQVVRVAKLRGLICVVQPGRGPNACRLRLSGPLALFRKTLIYGRALASVVPALSWCDRFALRARLLWQREERELAVDSSDPLLPAPASAPYDSELERRFARDFARAAPEWEIVREPQPMATGAGLLFPDFLLRHRREPRRSFLVEIVGFWTPAYLRSKLDKLRRVDRERLIVCLDADRQCADGELPARAPVIRYRRRIDPADVLAVIDPAAPRTPEATRG